MNTQIILSGLKARPVRTAVSLLAVTLEVVLILMLVGLTTGIVDETGRRVAGVGAEILLKAQDASYFVGMNPAILPVKELREDIKKIEGVVAVAPVVTQTNTAGGMNVIYGIESDSFNAVSGGFKFVEGRMFSSPDEALVDDWQASSQNIKVGDRVEWLRHMFTVTGIVENGKGARVFIPIETAQEMTSHPNSATMFYVKIRDKAETKEAIARMKAALPGYEIVDVDAFVSLMFSENASLLDAFFKAIVLLGASIGILVIFLSMYTTVTERTREIGILRSMGASKGFILALVLQECLLICVVGAALGIGASFVLGIVLKKAFPTLVILITPGWVVRATVFAILSGLVGSIYPAVKAAAQDPIEALAYE